jgi:hypothetical protein
VQVVSLRRSYEVDAGRQGCCTSPLYQLLVFEAKRQLLR